MKNRVIAQFYIPAVIDTSDHRKEWKYSGWRVVVTEGADVQTTGYFANIVRS